MSDAPHRNTARVVEAAAAHGLHIEVSRFPEGTRTAEDAAAAIGCPVAAIVKSLVLACDEGPMLVLTSGSNLVDYGKVAQALGAPGVRRADAKEARTATGFPIGGTPPFGHATVLRMLIDEDLLAHSRVWAAAGTPDTVFPIEPHLLRDISGASPAAVSAG